MKLRIFTLLTVFALLFTCLTACVETPTDPEDTTDSETESSTQGAETESESETDTASDPVNVNVYTLNGTTGFGFAKMMNDAKNGASLRRAWRNLKTSSRAEAVPPKILTDTVALRKSTLVTTSVTETSIPGASGGNFSR